MDLDTIRGEVLQRVGLSSTDAMAADAVMTDFVNAAYRQIALEKDWDWLIADETIAVTADDDEYAVAGDWRKTLYVGRQIDSSYPDGYAPMYRQNRLSLRRWSAYSGVPTFWQIDAGVLRIAPVPSTTWTLLHVYLKQITALSADTDVPFMPEDYIDYLVVRTAKILATRLGDPEMRAGLREEERELRLSIDDEELRSRGVIVPEYRQDTAWGG